MIFSDTELCLRLVIAAVLGGVVGFERELRLKAAGFRTNILICLGAALLTVVSIKITHDYTTTVADPGRIAAQIVTGIGFLGAGAIIQARGAVTGLTTAASIWVTAAIGIAIGAGYYAAAVTVAVLTVITLHSLVPFERVVRKRHEAVRYYVKYSRNAEIDELVKQFYKGSRVKLEELNFDIFGNDTVVRFGIKDRSARHDEFLKKIAEIDNNALVVHF
ncbi:MgtC/SapB family protein [candidate division KSB1 bacterium]